MFEKNIENYIFAHKNTLLGIFAPGTVPRSSALCLFECERVKSRIDGWGFTFFVGNSTPSK